MGDFSVSSLNSELISVAAAERKLVFKEGIEERLCAYSPTVAHHFPTTVKEVRFKVEGHEASVLLQIHRSYNSWRYSLKKNWLLKYDIITKALANILPEITREDA
ncbi:uncharacterized protein LOC120068141 [Benincasa hispida]|uniref:uncharacterized protein LOC120068141 n=1 Tax=Benincasa hispida TaxID=102211 RepID=UPI001900ACDF|nr:uncharacterized protein LOC120068141 [Benincasa hispida]